MKFFNDFFRTFYSFLVEGVRIVGSFIYFLVGSFVSVFKRAVIPATISLLQDINFILIIAWQGLLWSLGGLLLFWSKVLTSASRYCFEKSEELLRKNWL